MALNQSALDEIAAMLKNGDSFDLVRYAAELLLQALIEAEATAKIGAGRYERSETRSNERNGYRERTLTTKAGDLNLKIPKLRQGSFFPSMLESRRRIDLALYAVVMEAYVLGVSTRSVDELVEALGIESGISRSEVSRICAGLDEQVAAFFSRRLDHARFPYVILDATYLHVREDHKVVSKAVVIATGINDQGGREVLGMAVGDSEEEAFWGPFLSGLRARGLSGVQLVISDQHAGLVAAIRRHLQGAAHQRCRVHAARNLLTHVPKASQETVAAAFRTKARGAIVRTVAAVRIAQRTRPALRNPNPSHDRRVEVGARHRPVEVGVAEAEHPPVGGEDPIALLVGGVAERHRGLVEVSDVASVALEQLAVEVPPPSYASCGTEFSISLPVWRGDHCSGGRRWAADRRGWDT